jgi:hypothetical protein
MTDRRIDRFARRLADPTLTRRRLLRDTALAAGAAAFPVRMFAAPVAAAAAVTSCDCGAYAADQYISCYNDVVGNAPIDNDSGILAGLQFGIANAGAIQICKGKDTDAAANCTEAPCPPNSHCFDPPSGGDPVCRPDCPDNPGYTKCGDTCVNLQTDNSNCGTCGHVCVGPSSCSAGHCIVVYA